MFLTANINNVSFSLICMIIALILLFIGAFIVEAVGGGTPWRPRIGFVAAGLFFFVLSVATG